jgi:hypothetical protein
LHIIQKWSYSIPVPLLYQPPSGVIANLFLFM